MTKPTAGLNLEALVRRLSKRIAKNRMVGKDANLSALILDRVDQDYPDLRSKCSHRVEYQAGVASI